MAALNASRNTKRRDPRRVSDPVAAGTTIHGGSMYALNAAGFAVPAGTAGAGPVRGLALEAIANEGAAGDLRIEGEAACAQFANSAGADEIGREDIGSVCYAADDQTVALTDTGGRQVAGRIHDVDAGGVWVELGAHSITINAGA